MKLRFIVQILDRILVPVGAVLVYSTLVKLIFIKLYTETMSQAQVTASSLLTNNIVKKLKQKSSNSSTLILLKQKSSNISTLILAELPHC